MTVSSEKSKLDNKDKDFLFDVLKRYDHFIATRHVGSLNPRAVACLNAVIASRAATWQSTSKTMQRSHSQQYKPNPSERQALMPAL